MYSAYKNCKIGALYKIYYNLYAVLVVVVMLAAYF